MILATPIRVRRSCACREPPAVGLHSRSIRIIPVTGAANGRDYLQAPVGIHLTAEGRAFLPAGLLASVAAALGTEAEVPKLRTSGLSSCGDR